MFVLKNVGKVYGSTPALREVTCQIPPNTMTAIMGPSGSGKSTLLRLLSFLEQPSTGTVTLDLNARQFSSVNGVKPWPQVTCVFQKQFLWPHLTLRRNIALPLNSLGVGQTKEKLEELIALFEMQAFIDRYPNEVSGGQAQRAALARAFALTPAVILLDEAHAGLDLEQQEGLNKHMLKLRASGVSLIIVTHSLHFARRYAEFLIVLEGGQVTDFGGQNVLSAPKSSYFRRVLTS
jgi:ABC-type sulfate/molybdate transport systems ATPase subunit